MVEVTPANIGNINNSGNARDRLVVLNKVPATPEAALPPVPENKAEVAGNAELAALLFKVLGKNGDLRNGNVADDKGALEQIKALAGDRFNLKSLQQAIDTGVISKGAALNAASRLVTEANEVSSKLPVAERGKIALSDKGLQDVLNALGEKNPFVGHEVSVGKSLNPQLAYYAPKVQPQHQP